ncbi:putative mfs [Diaporthe ampelina]|uniref:Putative mfs n=1 Tax=Diaporthe ampelina TaxID=1214573 RepID=A0A0G2HFM0_9PEZI|nr:putative mfs [Diaporthe ampelina]
MGMAQQIKLVGNEYSHAYADFWIASLVFSLPNVWLLNRLPVAKFLGCCLIGWGLCNACHAALEDYAGLVALRVLSGAFESGILPALILIASQYFTYDEQSTRFSFWYSGMGVGQIFGGLISFGFQHVSADAALSGWKTMFLMLGLTTIAFGILVLFMVPDTPMTARFLSNDDKVALLEHVKVNQTGIQNTHFYPGQLLEGVLDLGCWLLLINVMLQLCGSGVVTAYSATILKSFDYTSKEAALLNMPCGVVNIIATMCNASFVRYYRHRWLVVTFAGVVGTIGAGLLCFLPHSNKGGLLLGMYLINVLPGATIIVFQWLSCNVAGHTKRAYVSAAANAAFAVGNIVGPETFRAKEAPDFRSAKLTLVIAWALLVALTPLAGGYYALKNRSRKRRADEVTDKQAYAGLTDKENLTFQYHL